MIFNCYISRYDILDKIFELYFKTFFNKNETFDNYIMFGLIINICKKCISDLKQQMKPRFSFLNDVNIVKY